MKIEVKLGDVANVATPLLIVDLFKGVKTPGGATGAVDGALDGAISKSIAAGEIEGKLGETLVIHTMGKIGAERVLVVGLDEREKFGSEEARRAAAAAVWTTEKLSIKEAATIVHGAGIGASSSAPSSQPSSQPSSVPSSEAAENTALGSLLAAYRFDKYKSKEDQKKPRLEKLVILEREKEKIATFESGVTRAEAVAWAQNFARDLVNEPANVMTPVEFAERVSEKAKEVGLDVEIFDEQWIQKKQMNLLWAVAKGSDDPPRLVVLRHQGGKKNDPWTAVIGKGVMFDSGGISIKAAQGMEAMKADMAGGAAVAGALLAAARLGVKRNVIGLVAAVKNLPDGRAQTPGDVVKSFDGPSVEVISTDAEGRMVMADALSYARELGASYLVDIATLTGACVTSLGTKVAALFASDEKMQKLFMDNVSHTGEKLWPMPMFDEYNELLKSTVAELKNVGYPAGAVTAAKFLEHFTGKKPWVHIDMAAKELVDKNYACYRKGATGFGVRTLISFVESWTP